LISTKRKVSADARRSVGRIEEAAGRHAKRKVKIGNEGSSQWAEAESLLRDKP
jgi:hypothetical protein